MDNNKIKIMKMVEENLDGEKRILDYAFMKIADCSPDDRTTGKTKKMLDFYETRAAVYNELKKMLDTLGYSVVLMGNKHTVSEKKQNGIPLGYRDVTFKKLAEELLKNKGKRIGFTLETVESIGDYGEPTGWYGATIVNPFDDEYGILISGYYGGGGSMCVSLDDLMADNNKPIGSVIDCITESLKEYVDFWEGYGLDTVCTDWFDTDDRDKD